MATHQKKHIKNTGSCELIYRCEKDGEHYAVVEAPTGDVRFKVTIHSTNVEAYAKACGSLIKGPKKKRIEKGNLVLLQKDGSNTGEDKYYIIHVYSQDDVKRLRKAGELAQIKEADDAEKVTVAFANEVICDKKYDQVEIDDDFISGI
jgi:hypothetical protein